MLRHYFTDTQFEIPTRKIWETVYEPLGFQKSYEELRESYEELRESYEELRESYEELRPVHNLDNGHCNIWVSKQITGSENARKNHICEKPVDILERIIRTSTRLGDTVLDLFMGSGSTGVACINTGRRFLGVEMEDESYAIARRRTGAALEDLKLAYTE
ncbi:MAG: site-specific DNA-methyltransferase [Hungatella sp.]